MVLLILGAVWAAVLVPPALRARAEASPGDSIGSFHHQLSVLRRTGGHRPRVGHDELGRAQRMPAPARVPMARHPAHLPHDSVRKRRRDVLVTLLWVMGGTLVLGLLPAFRALLWIHLLADLLFVAYIALLLHFKRTSHRARGGRAATVTRLPRHRSPRLADLSLRRAAGN